MKTTATILFSLFVNILFLCQTKDNIADIRAKYRQINQNIKTFSKREKEDYGQSTDGGTVVGYYKDRQLQLISTEYFGESGKIKTAYYFDNRMLILVVNNDFLYNRPYYWNEKYARENNDTTW